MARHSHSNGNGNSNSHHHHHHSRHEHGSPTIQPPAVAAAAAAAAAQLARGPLAHHQAGSGVRAPAGGGSGGGGDSHSDLAAARVVEHFRRLLQGEGPDHPANDVQKARNAFEATAGNLQMAAQLYWDDYIASQAVVQAKPPQAQQQQLLQQNEEAADIDSKPAARRQPREDTDQSEESDAEQFDYDDHGNKYPHRKLRRSLDRDFGRVNDVKPPADDNDESGTDSDMDDGEGVNINPAILQQQQQRQIMEEDDDEEDEEDDDDDDEPPQQQHDREGMGESVSVSDDETGTAGVWSIVGRMSAPMDVDDSARNVRRDRIIQEQQRVKKIREAADAVASQVLPNQGKPDDDMKQRSRSSDMDVDTEDDDDDYISDSDWLDEDLSSVKPPFEGLWETGDGLKTVSSSAIHEDDNSSENNPAGDDEAKTAALSGIPYTWVNASFSLSSCGTGLIVKPPNYIDVEQFIWRQNRNGNNRNAVPSPYHCKSITAILSIVTALMYSGASIQGEEVNCNAHQKPFVELTPDERKKQFESRLANALSSLIFVAAKASLLRKKRAAKKILADESPDTIKSKLVKRRLRLVPTCSWQVDPNPGLPRAFGWPLYRKMKIQASWTNINDIRMYVLSTMNRFTSAGGVALFLETIMRIHGAGVISRMMKQGSGSSNNASRFLVRCTCEERQKQIYKDNPLPANVRNDTDKLLDTTPPGNECVSEELLSLLLTGTPHSTFKGWSTDGLGVGLLTRKAGEVGCRLVRPEKPVWLVRGDTCYSVLWVENGKELDMRKVSKLDKPGTSMELGHWNCWYDQQNKTTMRLITPMDEWRPPSGYRKLTPAIWSSARDPLTRRKVTDVLLEARREKQANLVSADEHEANEKLEKENRITDDELDRCTPHPDDVRFYPGKFQLWRFDLGQADDVGDDVNTNDDDSRAIGDIKLRPQQWLPYHRLSTRQKQIVELKVGPKIKQILWSRWPGATVDKFATPSTISSSSSSKPSTSRTNNNNNNNNDNDGGGDNNNAVVLGGRGAAGLPII